ncbi:WD40 repeat domain-containing protein [Catenovulum adriaticum]|uniref:WD-40 repeat-containing protein n=1 Tax=Catenovulum adriaticum TaxID=2984846 RepID=A0ABY7ANU2_9ALTE|nr:hypothetical protein [Catenovulum sp. TS8]WAJ70105.1 hypothetical protein OLW01_13325 [Catenovulum sp. TS8]
MANISTCNISIIDKLIYVIGLSLLLGACTSEPPKEVNRQIHTDKGAYAADLSQNGLWAAVSTPQGIRLWDTQARLPKYLWQQRPSQTNQVHIVKISQDNQVALTADKQSFAVWNMQTGANKGYYKIDDANIAAAQISNKGEYVVLGLLNGKIIHINLLTGRRIEFLAHKERISALAMSANGQYVLSGDYAGKALFWDSRTAQVVSQINHQGRVSQLGLDQKARFAFTANSTNQSWIWDLSTGTKISKLQYTARQQIFTAVKFSHNGHLLATGAPNHKVKLWTVNSGELIASWPFVSDNFAATVLDFAFSEDDSYLTAETSYGVMQTWDIQLIK